MEFNWKNWSNGQSREAYFCTLVIDLSSQVTTRRWTVEIIEVACDCR